MDRLRLTLEAIIANSRWLIAPFLLGLILTLAGLLYNFVLKLFDFFARPDRRSVRNHCGKPEVGRRRPHGQFDRDRDLLELRELPGAN
jgi:hypothetical protein